MKNNWKDIKKKSGERSAQEILHELHAELGDLCCDPRVPDDIAQRLLDASSAVAVVDGKYRSGEQYYEQAHRKWRKIQKEGE